REEPCALFRDFLFIFLICVFNSQLNAQVTIGDDTDPADFSLLELTTTQQTGGLRLPQLSTAQREALKSKLDANPTKAFGLVIYNTDTKCQEYWNGSKWISLCFGSADMAIVRGSGANPTGPDDPTAGDSYFNAGGEVWGPYTISETVPCENVDPAYDIIIIAGSENMAVVKADDGTDNFYLEMFGNANTNRSRTAIIRVTNNCSKEYKDFILKQDGATCPANPAQHSFTLSPSTNQTLCSNGSVYVSVNVTGTNINPVDYIWTLNDVIVHTGLYYEITRPGKYKVYAGLAGCDNVTPQEITVTLDSETFAPAPCTIFASNNGILCGNSSITLTAYNYPEGSTIVWYHNGKEEARNSPAAGPSIVVSGAAASGNWTARVALGTCTSLSSNSVFLLDQTNTVGGPRTIEATVNGIPLGDNIKICKGGTLTLKVESVSGFNAGAVYEWFANGVSIYRGNEPETYYVAEDVQTLTLEVQVTDNSGLCPVSVVSRSLNTVTGTPPKPQINNGDETVLICGTAVARLTPSVYADGIRYEWFRNNVMYRDYTAGQPDAATESVVTPGTYRVRCMIDGCWSQLSEPIEVIQSNIIGIRWNIEPEAEAVFNESPTYSVTTSPEADSYEWTADPASAVQIIPIGNGSSAMVKYLEQPDELSVRIIATAANACGSKSVEKVVLAKPGCNPVTNVSINAPKIEMLTSESLTISIANSDGDDEDKKFDWYVNGTMETTTSALAASGAYTFNRNTPGTYTIYSEAYNSCTGTKVRSNTLQITVIRNVEPIAFDQTDLYKITGTICFDVNRTGTRTLCGQAGNNAYSKRQNTFAGGKTFTYTFFSPGGSQVPADIEYVVQDYSTIVKSYTKVGNNLQITFVDNIETRAQGYSSNAAGLKVYIYAIYTNGGNLVKKKRTLTVKDCICGGIVNGYASGNNGSQTVTELVVNSYNLGADQSIDPFDSDLTLAERKSLNGDFYQWGRNVIVGTADGRNASFNAGPLTNDGVSEWPIGADPCKSLGYEWRLPTKYETAVIGQTLGEARGAWGSAYSGRFTAGRTATTNNDVWFPATGFISGSNLSDNSPGSRPYYTAQYQGTATGVLVGRAERTEIVSSNTTMLGRNEGTVNGHWFPAYTIVRQSSKDDTETSKRYGRVIRCVK
ncbi:MAG: hypothetical protein LIO93_08250, partial [Bacteroidales bacterium]|nr:hypothetical protein [Bacteroidales bacterium]